MWLTVQDVMVLLGGVSRSKAYKVMKSIGDEIVKTRMPGKEICYGRPPAGKIQKVLFCEKFLIDPEECETTLAQRRGA